MIQFLSPLLGGMGSVISATTGLVGAGVKTAFKAMSSTKQSVEDAQEVAAQGTAAEESGGGGNGDKDEGGGKDEKKIKKSMFGGLDLANIKSQIDGPMGPPEPEEEVKGGVYKQIFAVNKSMLASLLGMEKSLKMLLSIEYERIQGMMSDDTDERQANLDKGETDPSKKSGNKFGGLLGKAAGGIGGLLGSAYSKAKGGLGGNFGKLLGIGALIFAFKKYPDEVKAAFKKILTFLKDTYDYFTAEDFTFEMFKTDFIDVFFPKMKGLLMGALDWLWNAVKGIASEFVLGAKGDKLIKQQTVKRERSVESLAGMTDLVAKSAGATGKMSFVGGKVAFQKKGLDALGFTGYTALGVMKEDNPQYAEFTAFQNALTDAVKSMGEITKASDGRIQFLGLPDMSDLEAVGDGLRNGSISVEELINAVPIIDGKISTMEDLKSFGLNRSAGTTKDMNQDNVKQIQENLSEMTSLTQMMQSIKGLVDVDGNNIGEFKLNKQMYTMATAKERYATLMAENEIFGQLSPQEILEMSGTSSISGTTGVSPLTQSLTAVTSAGSNALPANLSSTSSPILQKVETKIDQSNKTVLNGSMGAFPTNDTIIADKNLKMSGVT